MCEYARREDESLAQWNERLLAEAVRLLAEEADSPEGQDPAQHDRRGRVLASYRRACWDAIRAERRRDHRRSSAG